MPNTFLTRYRLVVNDLKELAVDVKEIAQDTIENISEVEAALAQYYLKQILEGLILATKIGRRTWPSLSQYNTNQRNYWLDKARLHHPREQSMRCTTALSQ